MRRLLEVTNNESTNVYNVVSAEWARNNGYSRPKLQVTTKADRSLPSSKNNPHHHKGVYMRYTDE